MLSYMNVIMVWAWMLWLAYVLVHERYYGLGMDVMKGMPGHATCAARKLVAPAPPSIAWNPHALQPAAEAAAICCAVGQKHTNNLSSKALIDIPLTNMEG